MVEVENFILENKLEDRQSLISMESECGLSQLVWCEATCVATENEAKMSPAMGFQSPSAFLPNNQVSSGSLEMYQPVISVSAADAWSDPAQVEVTVPADKVGLLIGRRGRTIKSLQERTKTKMQIIPGAESNDPLVDPIQKTLLITGTPNSVVEAEQLVLDLLSKAPSMVNRVVENIPYDMPEDPRPGRSYHRFPRSVSSCSSSSGPGRIKTRRFPVPKVAVGLIIGKGGETIKRLRRETGAKVQFNPLTGTVGDTEEQIATVIGRTEQIRHACQLINDLVATAINCYNAEAILTDAPLQEPWNPPYISASDSDQDYDDERMPPVAEDDHKTGSNESIKFNESHPRTGRGVEQRGRAQRFQAREFRASSHSQGDYRHSSRPYIQKINPYYAGREWGQGDPSQWNQPWEETQFCPAFSTDQSECYMPMPPQISTEYSNWTQCIPTCKGYQLPEDVSDEKTEFVPPIPIMSATIVQNPDKAAPHFLGPPKIYFNVPNFQSSAQNCSAGQDEPKICKDGSENKPGGLRPHSANEDGETAEIKEKKQDQEDTLKQKLAEGANPEDCNNNNYTANQPIPQYGYPTNLGSPGSCTRIVSFYYDLNVNNIVIMNQWHFY